MVNTSWLNQATESSAKTEINKDTRGTLNQVYDWFVIHDLFNDWINVSSDLNCIPAVSAFIYRRKQVVNTSWLNQATESSAKTEINKDTRGTLNQVYDWFVIHDFMIA